MRATCRQRTPRTACRGAAAATARASAIVSTSRSARQLDGAQAELGQPRALDGRRSSARSSARRGTRPASGRRSPMPSSRRRARRRTRRPRASSACEPGVEQRGRHLRRVHADQERRAAGVGERRGQPLGQAVAALRHHLEAARDPRPGLAVEHEHAPPGAARPRDGARACRPARRPPAPPPARACTAGDSRVLTRPGTGALAITTRSAVTAAPPPCRGPRAPCRAPCPSPSSDPPAGGRRRRPRGSASRRRRRAGPSPAASRSAGRAIAEREQRLAAGGAHRPEVGQPRAGAAAQLQREHAVGDRARAAARRRGARRARGRRRPPRTGPATRGQLARVERRVAVHEADDLGARRRAGRRSRPRRSPRTRLVHDPGAELRGQRARAVGRAVVDHDRRVAGGHARRAPRAGPRARRGRAGSTSATPARLSYPRCYAAVAIHGLTSLRSRP